MSYMITTDDASDTAQCEQLSGGTAARSIWTAILPLP